MPMRPSQTDRSKGCIPTYPLSYCLSSNWGRTLTDSEALFAHHMLMLEQRRELQRNKTSEENERYSGSYAAVEDQTHTWLHGGFGVGIRDGLLLRRTTAAEIATLKLVRAAGIPTLVQDCYHHAGRHYVWERPCVGPNAFHRDQRTPIVTLTQYLEDSAANDALYTSNDRRFSAQTQHALQEIAKQVSNLMSQLNRIASEARTVDTPVETVQAIDGSDWLVPPQLAIRGQDRAGNQAGPCSSDEFWDKLEHFRVDSDYGSTRVTLCELNSLRWVPPLAAIHKKRDWPLRFMHTFLSSDYIIIDRSDSHSPKVKALAGLQWCAWVPLPYGLICKNDLRMPGQEEWQCAWIRCVSEPLLRAHGPQSLNDYSPATEWARLGRTLPPYNVGEYHEYHAGASPLAQLLQDFDRTLITKVGFDVDPVRITDIGRIGADVIIWETFKNLGRRR